MQIFITAPSETASLAPLGEDVEEMDITEFTEMTKFNTEVTTGVAGAELRDGDEDVEAESDGCVVTIETVVMKPLGEERWWQVALQVSLPFIVAGVGMVGAGVVLGIVQVRPYRLLGSFFVMLGCAVVNHRMLCFMCFLVKLCVNKFIEQSVSSLIDCI